MDDEFCLGPTESEVQKAYPGKIYNNLRSRIDRYQG